jgi:hypothetical protein
MLSSGVREGNETSSAVYVKTNLQSTSEIQEAHTLYLARVSCYATLSTYVLRPLGATPQHLRSTKAYPNVYTREQS